MDKKLIMRRMLRSGFFITGAIILTIIIVLSLLAPVICRYSPTASSLKDRLLAPEWFSRGLDGHILGTDHMGRDLFTRLLYGARISIFIAVVVCVSSAIIGTCLGLVAGYFGGLADSIIMRAIEVLQAIPNIILAICVLSLLGASTTNLIIILVLGRMGLFCRLARSNVMAYRNADFVRVSRSIGASNSHIIFTQILPNITTPLIVQLSQAFGSNIMIESSLSFLGMGIQAPKPSWGNMISDGRKYLATSPWVCFVPGVALMFVVLAFNFLGDGLRDVLDPKRI